MLKAPSGALSKFFGDLRRYQSVQQHGFFDPEKTKYPVNELLNKYAKPVFYSMKEVNSTDTVDLASQFKAQQEDSEADASLITATEFISAKEDDKTRIPNFLDAATTMNEREQFAGWKGKVRACQAKVMRAMGVAPIEPEPLNSETRQNVSKNKGKAKAASSNHRGNVNPNRGFDQKEIEEAIRLSEEEAKSGKKARHLDRDEIGESSASRGATLAGSSKQGKKGASSREIDDLEQALKNSLTEF